MAERASRHCLARAGTDAAQIGLVILSSATSSQRFPGPASRWRSASAWPVYPPSTSRWPAPLLFGLALASQLAPVYGTVLVAAAEKMSGPASSEPLDRNVAILFGDGAGACLVTHSPGTLEIVDSVLHSDGTYADDLRLPFSGPIHMDGRTVILQASRRMPGAIRELIDRHSVDAASVHSFLLHQANNTSPRE